MEINVVADFACSRHGPNSCDVIFEIPYLSILNHRQAGRFRPNPQIRLVVFEEENDFVRFESRRVHFVKQSEAISVKANQAMERSNPEITVGSLQDGNGSVVRQTFLRVPGIDDEWRL